MPHSGYDRPRLGQPQPDIDTAPPDETRAENLYLRYRARPWALLPETTREHFRNLVADGIDGQGLPLDLEAPDLTRLRQA